MVSVRDLVQHANVPCAATHTHPAQPAFTTSKSSWSLGPAICLLLSGMPRACKIPHEWVVGLASQSLFLCLLGNVGDVPSLEVSKTLLPLKSIFNLMFVCVHANGVRGF